MNQKILIGVLVVAVLILGGTTVYLLNAQKSAKPVAQTPTPISKTLPATEKTSPVVQNSPVVPIMQDETANWKTYKNDEYGYSLQYPNNWEGSDSINAFSEASFYQANESYPLLNITAYRKNGTKIDELKKMSSYAHGNDWLPVNMFDAKSAYHKEFKLEEKVIDGKTVSGSVVRLVFLVENNNFIYEIASSIEDNSSLSKNKNIVNKILSTFQFTK